jgi:peptide-methionine (S)-S-oxide reductase
MMLSQQLVAKTAEAIFAGGCFWCVEADFDKLPGVLKTTSGYDGGTKPDPNYDTVSSGKTVNFVITVDSIVVSSFS